MAEPKRRRRRPVPVEIGPNEADRDILDQYFAEVSRYPLLNAEQERELARRIRKGDHDALEELTKRNLRFVVSVAKKYQNRGLPLIDLIGEGNVGLLTAARKFDPDQGVKFISYAVWWIRQAILSSLARQGRTVRVPLNRTADLSRVIKASALLRDKLGREPTPDEVAHLTGIERALVPILLGLGTAEIRLDAPITAESDQVVMERFTADLIPEAEAERLAAFREADLDRVLQVLMPRDARVVRLYFGLGDEREHTLDEIGRLLGVTRERVRQLRDRALKHLRESEWRDVLRDIAA